MSLALALAHSSGHAGGAPLRDFLRDKEVVAVREHFCTHGEMPYLTFGFRVLPVGLSVRRATWKRFERRLRHLEWEERRGSIDEEELARRVGSLVAHVRRGATRGLRARLLAVREVRARTREAS